VLITKSHEARIKSVTTNEEFIAKGGFSSGEECSSDGEMEMAEGNEEKDFLAT
jgi:hypothetical protein